MLEALDIAPELLAGLIPKSYAAFGPIALDALTFFLTRLPEERATLIAIDQAMLPSDVDVRVRVAHLLHASPVLHKLGQVIARRRELDAALREQLIGLESMEPRTPIEQVSQIVERELRPFIHDYSIEVGDAALAEASVAVVLPLRWIDPTDGTPRDAVAKVLKPGVAELLRRDLEILAELADFLDRRVGDAHLENVDFRQTFDDVRSLLENEIEFDREQTHLRQASRQYANHPHVHIPALLPFCTPALTAMERIRGRKVTDLTRTGPAHDRRLFDSIVHALLVDVILTRDATTLFHGDPHAGNLFITDDDRQLAPLDWSLAGTLDHAQRRQLAQLQLGMIFRDELRILRALERLAASSLDTSAARTLIRRRIQPLRLAPAGLRDAMHLLDDLALSAGVRFPADLMMFRKSFFTLEGVLADVCPEASIEQVLSTAILQRLGQEWPLRCFQPATSANYDTHLSTADLLDAVMLSPLHFAQALGHFFIPAGNKTALDFYP